jgi:conserved oligomeric Golgi complex subunit 3
VSVSLDEEDDYEPAILALPPAEVQESWFPSLRTTLWILSCLYTYVDVSLGKLS